jgi:hypothetical protein
MKPAKSGHSDTDQESSSPPPTLQTEKRPIREELIKYLYFCTASFSSIKVQIQV